MKVTVIGGGLAGSEAALQLARQGINVVLYEMRPNKLTEAHRTGNFAELVCSNSLGSISADDARGLLKQEALSLGSVLIKAALENRVPAGKALAVDRAKFSEEVGRLICTNPLITVLRESVDNIDFDGVVIVATGPLTTKPLLYDLIEKFSHDNLFFYDAISPIILKESLDMGKLFYGGRYSQSSDYLNAPMSEIEYRLFYESLIKAQRHVPHDFDKQFFESCLPIEEIALSGLDSMRYGPLTPRGFDGNHFAIVQLRRENLEDSMYELVGFQTSLTYDEQKRVFRLIPGLSNSQFVRFGSIHKNAFLKSSEILSGTLQTKKISNVFIAGQLSGVEGYVESISTGLLAGINAARLVRGLELIQLPIKTMLGSLINFIIGNDLSHPQPMRVNFGLMPKEFFDLSKHDRKSNFAQKSKEEISKIKELI